MDKSDKKQIIGILGGIASGKSTVAVEFAKLGCKVIDADKIAHEMLDNPDIKEKILVSFGQRVLDGTGRISHSKLADIVFSDKEKLSQLNSIVHPPVFARVEELVERYSRQAEVRVIVLDMPLLVETGWSKRCDRLIFVDCNEKTRLKRAKKIGLFDENKIKIREKFQISLDNKADLADNVIDNNSGLALLSKQIVDIFSYIVNDG